MKERKKEDELFGDAPKYLTSAYKKKLMEDQKWEYEDQLAAQVESKTDVRGKGMQGFYSNLLSKNVAFGGDVETSAVSAYTAGSSRQQKLIESKVEMNLSLREGCNSSSSTSQNRVQETHTEQPVPESAQDKLKRKRMPEGDVQERHDRRGDGA